MADAALVRLSLVEAADRVRRRPLAPVALAEAVLAQMDTLNPTLNAFITLVPREQVLAPARAAEREIAARTYRGLLHGIPVSVKDLIDTAGLRTTYGSGMFRDHVPERDGGVPERLHAAGAIITGKTATHELGQGMTTSNYFFGPTRNPWNPEHVPGGSSGGAAAAAAALMGPLHIGTDGGGSIRFPAAFCGVTGLKPTLGLISNRGQFGGAGTSFSVPGPLTRTVRDAALAAQALAGFDPEHLYSRPGPAPDPVGGLEGGVRGLRVGTSPDLLLTPPEPAVRAGRAHARPAHRHRRVHLRAPLRSLLRRREPGRHPVRTAPRGDERRAPGRDPDHRARRRRRARAARRVRARAGGAGAPRAGAGARGAGVRPHASDTPNLPPPVRRSLPPCHPGWKRPGMAVPQSRQLS